MPTTHISRIRLAIVAMLALMGVMLATAGGAAAYDYYWAKSGTTYSCQGMPALTICKSKIGGRYGVMLDNTGVTVFTGTKSAPHVQFWCKTSCEDLRP